MADRPGNAVGWIFAGALPLPVVAGWYASWNWYPTIALALVFTPLLFPGGRLPSPRWWPVPWLAGATTVAASALTAVQPTVDLGGGRHVDNPIGMAAVTSPIWNRIEDLLGMLAVVAVASLVVRFRRSRRRAPPAQVVHLCGRPAAAGLRG